MAMHARCHSTGLRGAPAGIGPGFGSHQNDSHGRTCPQRVRKMPSGRYTAQRAGVHLPTELQCASGPGNSWEQVVPTATGHQHSGPAVPQVRRPRHTTWLNSGAADAPGSPFFELRLAELVVDALRIKRRNYSMLYKQRLKQHAGCEQSCITLAGDSTHDAAALSWENVYENASLPLVLDCGCGAGRFLLLLAHQQCHCDQGKGQHRAASSGSGMLHDATCTNFLGLDVQPALVQRANAWAAAHGLSGRLHFLHHCLGGSQATSLLSGMLSSYPGPLVLACFNFPDPVANHPERCVLQPSLVQDLVQLLPVNGHVLLQSDDAATAAYMQTCFHTAGSGAFMEVPALVLAREGAAGPAGRVPSQQPSASRQPSEDGAWLAESPLSSPTERELYCAAHDIHVWRLLLRRAGQREGHTACSPGD